jgi:hypothetical protein
MKNDENGGARKEFMMAHKPPTSSGSREKREREA